MVGLVLVLGGLDFAFARVGWAAMVLSAALTTLLVPWAVLLFRQDAAQPSPRRRRRSTAVHVLTLAAVLPVLAAKWLAVENLLSDEKYVHAYRTYSNLLIVLMLLGLAVRGGRLGRLMAAAADQPTRLMALSFALTALVGALLLSLPLSLQRPDEVSLVDALFMATSAVCVTGLGTLNVAETYTFAGQVVLCGLIQVGGLGIMVLTAAVTMLAGRRLGLRSSVVLAESVDLRSITDLRRTIGMILFYTLVIEGIGASLLYLELRARPEVTAPIWAAVFHAVSAFCNAGFSIFPKNLEPFVTSPLPCQTVAVLVVVGGLGFPVIHELVTQAWCRLRRRRPTRVTLHTRLVLRTSAILLVGMTVAYAILERKASFAGLGFLDSLNAALFHSVVARTAGFNVVDVGKMLPASLLLTCMAMFVGGSPGSTSGGIKTTTLAVLFAGYRGELRGRKPRLLDRNLPPSVVRRAMGVGFLATAVVTAVIFVLVLIEKHDPLALTFEAVSAFTTTGLSTGITPQLSSVGKLVLVLAMLTGRVGPLTAALALSTEGKPPAYELPEERVMIG